jgi:hypothetical protein
VAQNVKKMALLLSKRGKGFVLCFYCILNFLHLFISLKYTTPFSFLEKRERGLSSSSAHSFVECFLFFLCRWRNWLVMKQSLHTKQKGVRVEIVYGLPEKKNGKRRASEVACVHDGREASAKP